MERDEFDKLDEYVNKHKYTKEMKELEQMCMNASQPIISLLGSFKDNDFRRYLATMIIAGLICSQSKNLDDNFALLNEIKEHLIDIDKVICKGDIK
jgi:hypothetical protein